MAQFDLFLVSKAEYDPSATRRGVQAEDLQRSRVLFPPEIIRNPIPFYASRMHQVMCSPDHRITPKEAWKVQYHQLQTALRHGQLGFTLTDRCLSVGLSFTPTAPMLPSKPPFLLCGWLAWKPVVSDHTP